jgi:hypothetical protein
VEFAAPCRIKQGKRSVLKYEKVEERKSSGQARFGTAEPTMAAAKRRFRALIQRRMTRNRSSGFIPRQDLKCHRNNRIPGRDHANPPSSGEFQKSLRITFFRRMVKFLSRLAVHAEIVSKVLCDGLTCGFVIPIRHLTLFSDKKCS